MRVTSLKTVISALQKFVTDNPKDKSHVVIASKIDDNHYKLVTAKPQVNKFYVYSEDLENDNITTLLSEDDFKNIPSLIASTTEVVLIEIP